MKKIILGMAAVLLLVALPKVNKAATMVAVAVTNVTCNGTCNGTIDITPSGGTPPYTYLWNDGITTEDRSGLCGGNYSVTITDNAGISNPASFTVIEPSAITTSTNITHVYCGGGNTGAIDLTVTGGTPGYTYAWSDFVYTEDRTNLTAANYYYTVTDANGCVKYDSANVTQPPGMVLSKAVTNVTCGAGANGAIDLTVQFGIPGYTYLWNDGIVTQDRVAAPAGNYSVTVTDASGCTASMTATISQSGAGMSINTTSINPSCNGGSNGSITVTSVIGSIAPYTFAWSDGATTQNRTGLAAGSYTVTATSITGCTASTTVNLTQPAVLSVALTPIQLTCFGSNNGAINTATSGGTPSYSYNWGGGVFTQNRTGLASGNYTVTVTDSKGCTATQTTFVPQPLQLTLTTTPSAQACTGGPTGSVTTNVSGGTGSYTYWWGSGVTTPDRINVNGGTYSVTVTDGNGCTSSASATVLSYTPMTLSSTQVNNTCYGTATGSIDLTVANGWAPYTYAWSNSAVTQDINSLAAGTYTVTVGDNHSCTATRIVTITQPSFPVIINAAVTNATCNGGNNGTITVSISNGSSPYSYSWNDGVITQNRAGLAAGVYNLTVTDISSCSVSSSIVVGEGSPIVITPVVTNAACFGSNNGTISLSVTGGVAPFSYNWGGGVNSQNRTALSAGTYTVTVTDNVGCTQTSTSAITQNPNLNVISVITNVTCNGANNGAVTITPSGGTAPYTYNWNGGATTQNRTSLSAGNYSVTVTDNLGCSGSLSAIITEPAVLAVTLNANNITCSGANNGTINTTVSGGMTSYTFLWSDGAATQNRTSLSGGSYTLTVTDNNACTSSASATIVDPLPITLSVNPTNVTCYSGNNGSILLSVGGGTGAYSYSWSNSSNTQNLNGLSAGFYSVVVADINLCSASTSTIVNQPTQITTSTVVSNATCFGVSNGTVDLTVNGGTGAYSYNWSNAASTQDITSVTAGTYHVTVTDGNSCTVSTSVVVSQSMQIVLAETHTNVSCNGGNNGSIDVTISGGTFPYTYNWSNGAVAQDVTNLTAGSYSVAVSDNNSCSANITVAITQPPVLTFSETHTNVTCYGANNGTINTTPGGGVSPYTFNWAGGNTLQNRTGLAPGSYSVTMSDANFCTSSLLVNITGPSPLTLSTTKTDVTCSGTSTGSIDLTVAGATPSYIYHWSNNAITQDLASVNAGTYNVTVTDANSCTATTSATITQPAPITMSFSLVNVSCYGGNNGSISTTTTGGNGNYTYIWSNGGTTPAINNLTAGNYTLWLMDGNACSTTLSFSVLQPTQIVLSETHTNVTCNGANNGTINLTAAGGAFPYTYLWSNAATTEDLSGVSPNIYSVTVTDDDGCTATKGPVSITQPGPISLSTVATNVVCNGAGTGSVDLTVTGGSTPYVYHWNNNATTQDIANLVSGTYTVTVTDGISCTVSTSALVNQSTPIIANGATISPTCFGYSNGSIATAPTGGAGSYTYNWNTGATTSGLNNVAAGNYTVTVYDASNCSVVSTVAVAEPAGMSISSTHTNVDCHGNSSGSIATTVTGGAGGYSYLWSNGATSASVSNLAANNYSVTVTDANSCSLSNSISITEPSSIVLSETHKPYACSSNTGSIDLTVAGGTAPYLYSWSGGMNTEDVSNLSAGNYLVNVTDAHSCVQSMTVSIAQIAPLTTSIAKTDVSCNGGNNGAITLTVQGGSGVYTFSWNTGAHTQNLSNLTAGNYRVLVIDSNNCNTIDTTIILEPNLIQITATTSDVTCNGLSDGYINLNVSGGTTAYTYSWNTADTTSGVSNLTSGNYSVTITDANSCTAINGNIQINQPQPLNVSSTVVPVACSGHTDGEIQLQVSGGAQPYSFNWNNSSTSANLTNLSTGSYDVTISDTKGCTVTGGYIIGALPDLVVSAAIRNTSCPQVQNGAIDLTVTGGSPSYNFDWSTGDATEDLNNISEGSYSVTVTDSRNCSATDAYNLAYDYMLTVDASPSTTIDLGETVQLTAVTNFDHSNVYLWTPAHSLSCSTCANTEATPLNNTLYTVNVVDANGCKASDTLSVSVNSITDIFIPNAFTPNSDNNNDVFQIYGDVNAIAFLDFAIFNRWGEKVFESNNHHFTWDGTYKGEPVPPGVYIYTAKVVFINGYSRNDLKGSLTIIR